MQRSIDTERLPDNCAARNSAALFYAKLSTPQAGCTLLQFVVVVVAMGTLFL